MRTCCSRAAYASLGEDMLVGQVNPKTVGQSWHIDARDENVDSALVRTLTKHAARQGDQRDAAERRGVRGAAEGAGAVPRARAKGGWKPIPAGKPLKRGRVGLAGAIAALRARLAAEGIDVPDGVGTQHADRRAHERRRPCARRRAGVRRVRRVRRRARGCGRAVPGASRHRRRQHARQGDARRAQRARRVPARADRGEPRAVPLAAARRSARATST